MNNKEFMVKSNELKVELDKLNNKIPNKIVGSDGKVDWSLVDGLLDELFVGSFFENLNYKDTVDPYGDSDIQSLECIMSPLGYDKFTDRKNHGDWIGMCKVRLDKPVVSIYVDPWEKFGGSYNFWVEDISPENIHQLGEVYKGFLDRLSEDDLIKLCGDKVKIQVVG